MEAIGAASSILAIVQLAGKVSIAATSFMRDVVDARRDMIQIKKNLSTLSAVLEVIAQDLTDNAPSTGILQSLHRQIVNIASSCRAVLVEIGEVIGPDRSRMGWVASGRARVDRLRAGLEDHMSFLDIALDMMSMIILREIKDDTTQILGDTNALRRDTSEIIKRLDQVQQKFSTGSGADDPPSHVMLDRYLDELRNDTETLLDNLEYQQDAFKDEPSQPQPEISVTAPLSLPVLFRDSRDRLFPVPFEACRIWTDMEEIIRQSCSDTTTETEDIEEGRYHLVASDDQIILPKLWERLVSPGMKIKLSIWQKPCQDEASNSAEEAKEADKAPILFRDTVGRCYRFPWHLARSWPWMEEAIKEAFHHVDVMGPHVQAGCYSVYDPDDDIIRPWLWWTTVKPGMTVTMKMWPASLMSEPPRPQQPQPEGTTAPRAKPKKQPGSKSGKKVASRFLAVLW